MLLSSLRRRFPLAPNSSASPQRTSRSFESCYHKTSCPRPASSNSTFTSLPTARRLRFAPFETGAKSLAFAVSFREPFPTPPTVLCAIAGFQSTPRRHLPPPRPRTRHHHHRLPNPPHRPARQHRLHRNRLMARPRIRSRWTHLHLSHHQLSTNQVSHATAHDAPNAHNSGAEGLERI